jgi:hypothetical protein
MNVSDLIPSVLAHAPSAPDPLVSRLLVDAAREFCEETRYWADDSLTADTTVKGSVYTPALPADAMVVDVQGVEHNGKPLILSTPAKTGRELGDDWRAQYSTPRFAIRSGVASVRVAPGTSEAATAALRFILELKPTVGATTLDDVFAEPYSETIVNGALARLLAITDKPWSSVSGAARFLTLFYSKFAEASSKADNNRTRNVPRKVKYGGL